MYIAKFENEPEEMNFLGGFFKEEESFGDKVASDLEAYKKADSDSKISTTKIIAGVAIVGALAFIGMKVFKKFKK